MSQLLVYDEQRPRQPRLTQNCSLEIGKELARIGVTFKYWPVPDSVDTGAPQDEIISACRDVLDPLMDDHGFKSMDVVSIDASHPAKDGLRSKLLREHTHHDDERRFFVSGCGVFNIHHGTRVYAVRCERGDLIVLPAGTRHWFDIGPQPDLQVIRLFTAYRGWVSKFTGDDVADQFPRLQAPQQVAVA